jgi:hypothetical protein
LKKEVNEKRAGHITQVVEYQFKKDKAYSSSSRMPQKKLYKITFGLCV